MKAYFIELKNGEMLPATGYGKVSAINFAVEYGVITAQDVVNVFRANKM